MLLFLSLIETEEERSFCEALYYRYRSAMFGLAMSYLRKEHDAEDVVQTVFCEVAAKYINKLEAYEEDARERFLLLVTKYRDLNYKKQRSRFISLDTALTDTGFVIGDIGDSDFVDAICKKAEYEELLKTIERLDPEDRAVIWMRFKLDLSSSEIADILAEKQAAIIKRLQRAKKKLASMLAWEGGAV